MNTQLLEAIKEQIIYFAPLLGGSIIAHYLGHPPEHKKIHAVCGFIIGLFASPTMHKFFNKNYIDLMFIQMFISGFASLILINLAKKTNSLINNIDNNQLNKIINNQITERDRREKENIQKKSE